ncbi:MAG: putative xanthine dehydrogenase subunit A [Gammaproteobacteria bacterium]|nr:putative xanthine dehydrogenase subunit A [Gammaproteobacteria bacterium]
MNLKTLMPAFRALRAARQPLVLATVIETAGSTYRKAGARMIVTGEGVFHGILGGGCFEGDLIDRANEVFASGGPATLYFDMRAPEDEVWGLGMGCDGAVRLLLERVDAGNGYEPLTTMETWLRTTGRAVLATVIASKRPGCASGSHHFLADDAALPESPDWLAAGCRQARFADRSMLLRQGVGGEEVTVFLDRLQPPPHLLILGAGADAAPVTQLARAMDWQVSVVDHRDAYAVPERFPAADRVLSAAPETLATKLRLQTVDAAVVMTHNIDYDERFLRQLAVTSIGYIGLLGPAPRRDRLLAALGDHAEALRGRVFGPVGLDLGARLPEEIALSITAQVLARLRGRSGGALRGRPARAHARC